MRRLALVLFSSLLVVSCTKTTPPSVAFKATSRAQLVGGKRALGEVGDYELSNGVIHAIIQDVGFSRGFGAFGGSLIDVDLVRPGPVDPVNGPKFGNDYFTEMFPAFFLQAFEPSKVEVVADGSDGGPAQLRVTGKSGDFLSIVRPANGTLIPQVDFTYTVDYILEPGASYLKIVCTLTNDSPTDALFPVSIPFGFITLLGDGQHLFVPGKAGYDTRFELEDHIYPTFPSTLTELPGLVAPMWATEGDGVSYALAASPRGSSYLVPPRDHLPDGGSYYPEARPDSMLIPVAYSSFLGSYWSRSPETLAAGKSWSYTGYLAVGSGDIASAQKVIYGISDEGGRQPVGMSTLNGRVTEVGTGLYLVDASVVVQDDQGNYVTQARTDQHGQWFAPVPQGRYRASVVDDVRGVASSDFVEVAEGGTATVDLVAPRAGVLEVVVRDDHGRALPAKVSVEGIYSHTGVEPPRTFLYSLPRASATACRTWCPTTADAQTRRYLEQVIFAPAGPGFRADSPGPLHGLRLARPGVRPRVEGGRHRRRARPPPSSWCCTQVMPTPGWVSGDFHVHSINSVDSNMSLEERVTSYAVEGVDYRRLHRPQLRHRPRSPRIDALKLTDWLHSAVGPRAHQPRDGPLQRLPAGAPAGAGDARELPLVLPAAGGAVRAAARPGEGPAEDDRAGEPPARLDPRVLQRASTSAPTTATPAPAVVDLRRSTQSPQPDGRLVALRPEQLLARLRRAARSSTASATRSSSPTAFRRCRSTGPSRPCRPAPPARWPTACPRRARCSSGPRSCSTAAATVQQPAYPGALEDWFNLLAHGKHVTATGNSDSHSAAAEAGLPRTYLQVGDTADGSMRGLSEAAAIQAIARGRRGGDQRALHRADRAANGARGAGARRGGGARRQRGPPREGDRRAVDRREAGAGAPRRGRPGAAAAAARHHPGAGDRRARCGST